MDFVSVDHMTNFFHGLPDYSKSLSRLDQSFRCILLVRGPQKRRGGVYTMAHPNVLLNHNVSVGRHREAVSALL
jgi:hypothetical protein